MSGQDHDTEKDQSQSQADERHREFSEENGHWNDKMEEALSDLDELAEGSDSGSSKSEPAPA